MGRVRLIVVALLVATVSGCVRADPEVEPSVDRGRPPATASASSSSSVPTVDPTAGGALAVPDSGAYFGTHFSASLPDRRGAITDLEEQIGRGFAIDHTYHDWEQPFPNEYDRWTVDTGRTLFLSWTTRRRDEPSAKWSDVAAGVYDRLIDQRATAVADLGVPVLMSFDHEPGAQVGAAAADSGTSEEYRRAWVHVADRFAAAGATNVSWVWTLTAYTFREGDPDAFYPGDDVVDWVGADGYANIECPWLDVPWRSWEEIFGAADVYAGERGKPLVIAEFSAREDPVDPGRKAEWLASLDDALQVLPRIKAVVSFNSVQPCSSGIASSDLAAEAYADLGASPRFLAEPTPAS